MDPTRDGAGPAVPIDESLVDEPLVGDPPEDEAAGEETWRRECLFELCSVDSSTGHEGRLRPLLDSLLRDLGADVHWQPVSGERANVLATWGPPRLLLSTHLDTVPPYLEPTPTSSGLRGRGTCDAKGQVVTQLSAIRRLLAAGESGVAWLGVVGEETNSDGARAAVDLRSRLPELGAVVVGEPTEGAIPSGQKGFLHLELRCRGRRAHGADPKASHPEWGTNALWHLLRWLDALRLADERVDPVFGREVWNLGVVEGGDAPNVVAGQARAELVVRTVPGSTFVDQCRRLAPREGTVLVRTEEAPVLYGGPAAFDIGRTRSEAVGFGSDAPNLAPLAAGRVFLYGPGSIARAHTDHERISWEALRWGVDDLVDLCHRLLRATASVRSTEQADSAGSITTAGSAETGEGVEP